MAYSTEVAGLLANQLKRFVTLNPHQLAGQVANLDFWLAEVAHALAVIDGYGVRFVRMDTVQVQFVAAHGATWKATPPRRIPDRELQKARRELTDAAIRFLECCRKDGLISEGEFTTAVESW